MNCPQYQLCRGRVGQLLLKGDVGSPDQPRATPSKALGAQTQYPSSTIVEKVAKFVGRFVFFRDPSVYYLVAAWIIATHMYKDFDYMGYLFAHSPEPQSGKTTLLEVLDHLVANSSGVQISVTEAVLFRTADCFTQLLDEIDAWQNRDSLRSVLNAGFKAGGKVSRMDKDSKQGLKLREFRVYCPRALAGIGNILDRTTRDRTFAIDMVRRKPAEKRESFRPRRISAEIEQLKNEIIQWVGANKYAVGQRYDNTCGFPYLEHFSERTQDIAEPLAAVLEIAYSGHCDFENAKSKLLSGIAITRKEQRAHTEQHRILLELLKLTQVEDSVLANATELASMLANLENMPNEKVISETLRQYGFSTKSVRKSGETNPLKRYELKKAALEDAVERWTQGDV